MRAFAAAAVLASLLVAATGAQDVFQWRRGGFRREAPRFATPESFDGGFNFCRLMYSSYTREAGRPGLVDRLP